MDILWYEKVRGIDMEAPLCIDCRYFRFALSESTPTCDAFPEGIPDEIWSNDIEHDHPIPGDHGLRFIEATDKEFNAKIRKAATERERRARQEG